MVQIIKLKTVIFKGFIMILCSGKRGEEDGFVVLLPTFTLRQYQNPVLETLNPKEQFLLVPA
jgi:hypothetical protein